MTGENIDFGITDTCFLLFLPPLCKLLSELVIILNLLELEYARHICKNMQDVLETGGFRISWT